jgi:hypothetical protein
MSKGTGDMTQGCQIFLGQNILKREKVPNDHKLHYTAKQYIKRPYQGYTK